MSEAELFRGRYRISTARLRGYDYGQSGAYFVTICTAGRVPHFGEVVVPGATGRRPQYALRRWANE